ncbi:MAG TPA: hypothetical protein VM639_02840 [Dongiaceae bacterium]|nr:hypothetical protein [Dongiaceae bacterium]
MVTFDSFSAYDVEKDVMRFRCHFGEQLVLCGVTRAALVVGARDDVSSRAALVKLYESRTQIIQRAVLHRLQRRNRADTSVLIIDVDDVYQLSSSSSPEPISVD